MRKYSLLLFDLDDTLLDNSSWFSVGLIQTLGIHSVTRTLDASVFLEQMLHPPKMILEPFIRREISPEAFKKARWSHALSYFNVRSDAILIDEIDALFFKTSMDYVCANESISALLKDLKRYYDVGIVTNGLYDPRLKIQQMGLAEVFSDDTIFHAEQLGYRKPDPQIYAVALEHFGKKSDETLFIGDSWTHDVVGPMETGIDAIWVNPKGLHQTTNHSPVAIVPDVTEIRRLLLN
ncbi:HAD family hydrolase [Paenibacillus terrigena]|uniref:HAD family hydrolase n=1 Tax=Paenibacillus terrigena TaxID=369333 RepID=UPI00035CD431|nr:HAD-IA family hydrolase [Paenibacillus terrigena]